MTTPTSTIRPRLFITHRAFQSWCARNNPHRPGTVAFRRWNADADADLARRHDRITVFLSGLGTGALIASTTIAALSERFS